MNECEQSIKKDEDRLKDQAEEFKKIKKRFRNSVSVVACIILATFLSFVKYTNTKYQRLVAHTDSLSSELRSREFLIEKGLEKSQLRKIKNLMSIYELNKKDIHNYTSFDVFFQEMHDRQKASDLYERLKKANVPIRMNFDQFYRSIEIEN